MARFKSSVLAAVVVSAVTEMAQACGAEAQPPPGMSAARLLARAVESYCTRTTLECDVEVCTLMTFTNVQIRVVPWIHKNPQVPWKVVIIADSIDSTATDLDRGCSYVASEASGVFGPGHLFATTLTAPEGKVHECPVVTTPLADQAPFAVLPEDWVVDESEPMSSFVVDLRPQILSELNCR